MSRSSTFKKPVKSLGTSEIVASRENDCEANVNQNTTYCIRGTSSGTVFTCPLQSLTANQLLVKIV